MTKFKKGLTQDTPKEPDNKKPSAPKPGMQPSPQPEGKNQAYRHNLVLRIKSHLLQNQICNQVLNQKARNQVYRHNPVLRIKAICSKTRYATKSSTRRQKPSVPAQPGTEDKKAICSKTRYATKSSTRRQETKRTGTTWY